ncbi:MAG: hypothetical protein R2724_03350 [Bryobacterales bacterium]
MRATALREAVLTAAALDIDVSQPHRRGLDARHRCVEPGRLRRTQHADFAATPLTANVADVRPAGMVTVAGRQRWRALDSQVDDQVVGERRGELELDRPFEARSTPAAGAALSEARTSAVCATARWSTAW